MLRDLSSPSGSWLVWDRVAEVAGIPEAVAALRLVERLTGDWIARGEVAVVIHPDGRLERLARFDPDAPLIVLVPHILPHIRGG